MANTKITNPELFNLGDSTSATQLPVMTTTQRIAMTGLSVGEMIFNSTTDKVEYWDGTKWYGITYEDEPFFNTVLYDGQATDLSVTGVGFEPDLVWVKCRDVTNNHVLSDSLRGDSTRRYPLFPNLTNAQSTTSNQIKTIDSDGFTAFGDKSATNRVNQEYVAWCFKAGGAPSGSDTVSIDGTSYADEAAAGLTAGNVAVTKLSANTKLGFSIATLDNVATSPSKTFSHGLGVPPELVIGKIYDGATDNWHVMSPLLGAANEMFLNTNDDTQAWTGFNNTNPDSNVVNIDWTTSTSYKMIFYSFASKTGVSKVGSYTGNGTTGQLITTDFQPRFLLVKCSSGSLSYHDWYIFDNKRTPSNPSDAYLRANESAAEVQSPTYNPTFESTGFRWEPGDDSGGWNASGFTYIYMTFA